MEEKKTQRTASLCIVGITVAFTVWLFIKYALAAAIPIVLSVLIASVLRPIAQGLAKRSGRPAKVYGVILALIVVFAVFYGLFCLGGKLIREMTEFLSSSLSGLEGEDNIIRQTLDFLDGLKDRFPILGRLASGEHGSLSDRVYETATEYLKSLMTAAGKRITSFAAGFITALPGVVFASAVSVISVFYLTVDYDGVKDSLRRIMPDGVYRRFAKIASSGAGALTGCIKAYLVLMLLTFAELLFGFMVLRVKYAFFLAAATAVVDILPVLGVGTVLFPWSAFLFIRGDNGRAVGLLVLFAVMYAVRQYAEPRIVGKFTGLHPMITLASAYFGYAFFGVAGMLASPIVLYGLRMIFSDRCD